MAARPPEGHPTDFHLDAKGAATTLPLSSMVRTPFATIR